MGFRTLAMLKMSSLLFFFIDTATTEIYTLSLHDALPISWVISRSPDWRSAWCRISATDRSISSRSEEHTSELQSHSDLVCRLLLEKKKTGPRRANSADCRSRAAAPATTASQPHRGASPCR